MGDITPDNAINVYNGEDKGYRLITRNKNRAKIYVDERFEVIDHVVLNARDNRKPTQAEPDTGQTNQPILDTPAEDTQNRTFGMLMTDIYHFNFEGKAPLFVEFKWGDLVYKNISADDLIRVLPNETTFGSAGYTIQWSTSTILEIKLGGTVNKEVIGFGWRTAEPITYKESSSRDASVNLALAYDGLRFTATGEDPNRPKLSSKAPRLTTSKYRLDFGEVEQRFVMFTFDNVVYRNVGFTELLRSLEKQSAWATREYTMRLNGTVLTIERMLGNKNDHETGVFGWETPGAITFYESQDAEPQYATLVEYESANFTPGQATAMSSSSGDYLMYELKDVSGDNLRLEYLPIPNYLTEGFNFALKLDAHHAGTGKELVVGRVQKMQGSEIVHFTQLNEVPVKNDQMQLIDLRLTLVYHDGVKYNNVADHASGDFQIRAVVKGESNVIELPQVSSGKTHQFRLASVIPERPADPDNDQVGVVDHTPTHNTETPTTPDGRPLPEGENSEVNEAKADNTEEALAGEGDQNQSPQEGDQVTETKEGDNQETEATEGEGTGTKQDGETEQETEQGEG